MSVSSGGQECAMPFVSSSAIRRIEYDADTANLHIWFTSGPRAYTYYGVPHAVYASFLAASSKGTFFDRYVKDRYSARAA